MKSFFVNEPDLEFGGNGRHIDIRFGLKATGPLDRGTPSAPPIVRVGVVGDAESVSLFREWVDKCRCGIEAKPSTLPMLFTDFPGFGDGQMLPDFVTATSACREIRGQDIEAWTKTEPRNLMIERSVSRYIDEASDLIGKGGVDAVVCALGPTLLKCIDVGGSEKRGPRSGRRTDHAPGERPLIWHDVLKARALKLGRPMQMSRPGTFGGPIQRYGKDGKATLRLQDEATVAWNFFSAMYYKAGGTPWRLAREASDLLSCYVGISFFYDQSGEALESSIAQVFNERGEGVIVKGGPAQINREDRTPHLAKGEAETLLIRAIKKFRQEHRTNPARLVLHKSSWFDDEEREGFRSAASAENIDTIDMVSIRKSFMRFFREGGHYPPLRGTAISLSDREVLCYTHSSVDFYRTYPGLYVPKPLLLRLDDCGTNTRDLVKEVLALSKMNWNSTHFNHALPITLAAAADVGSILRHVSGDAPQARYSYYM